MKIDETLKENLITDVEQTLDITLTDNDKTSLARCFEITIGHHYASQSRDTVSDPKEEVQPLEGGCICQKCGNNYRLDINIPDLIWNKIHGSLNLLCGNCIVSLIEEKIGFSALFLNEYASLPAKSESKEVIDKIWDECYRAPKVT